MDQQTVGPTDQWTDGWTKPQILTDSARASKTLQFGHQFHLNLSIQCGDISKIVKNVKIDHQIHVVKKHSYPSIFEMLSNLNKKR